MPRPHVTVPGDFDCGLGQVTVAAKARPAGGPDAAASSRHAAAAVARRPGGPGSLPGWPRAGPSGQAADGVNASVGTDY